MELKSRRVELEQALQRAQQEAAGWMQRIQQILGAISENEKMQKEETLAEVAHGMYDEDGKISEAVQRGEDKPNGHGDAGVGQPAGGKAGPPVRPA